MKSYITIANDGLDALPLAHQDSRREPDQTTAPGDTRHGPDAWLTALRFSVGMLVLCGLLYPFVSTGIDGALFPFQAGGSIVRVDGRAIGSALVAQPFTSARYFQPRPSSSGYDPVHMAGSNLAPSNPELRKQVAARIAAIARRDGIPAAQVPADLAYASGSSIDPDISPAAARIQMARVARARHLPLSTVRQLVAAHTRGPGLGILGQARVNVLALNLALDALADRSHGT